MSHVIKVFVASAVAGFLVAIIYKMHEDAVYSGYKAGYEDAIKLFGTHPRNMDTIRIESECGKRWTI